MTNLKQLKLANDEEIICEVMNEPTEEEPDLVIRKVLKLMCVDDYERNVRYYSFKPWMSFTEDVSDLQTLNTLHIVGQMNPSTDLAVHYAQALKEAENSGKGRKSLNLDEVLSEIDIDEMSEEEMDSYLDYKFAEKNKDDIKDTLRAIADDDSSDSNIIRFKLKDKDKDTMH